MPIKLSEANDAIVASDLTNEEKGTLLVFVGELHNEGKLKNVNVSAEYPPPIIAHALLRTMRQGAASSSSAPGPSGREQTFEQMTEKFGLMLRASVEELSQEMMHSRNSVSASALLKLHHSIFAIMMHEPQESGGKRKGVAKEDEICCAGFFSREPGLAATANHCLGDMKKVGDKVTVFMVASKVFLELTIEKRDEKLDFALLRFEVPLNSPLGGPGTVFLEVDTDSEVMRYGVTLALCTCSLTLGKEAGDVDHGVPSFAIMPATAIRPTSKKHHLIYACQSFSGDCGSALVLHDGKLVGLHVMGVNELKERIGHKKTTLDRLDDLEESVDSAVAGVASGSIALLAMLMK